MQTTYQPRNLEVKRYNDLQSFVAKVYADGIVSPDEMKDLTVLKQDTLAEYQVVNEMLEKVDRSSSLYDRLKTLQLHLRRGWQLLDYATDRATSYNEMSNEDKIKKNARQNTHQILDLGQDLTMVQMALLIESLTGPEKARVAEERLKKELSELTPENKQRVTKRVANTLTHMEKEQMNEMQLNRMLGLERSR